MQALKKRHIKSGHEYDKLFPKSSRQDTVIQGAGKAKLHHTINLMRDMVHETKGDTKLLAQMLKGQSREETCRNIWNFVYNHIRYRRDKKGVEQVRRPARTWAERKRGVDCDCYTVFISSILINLDISHSVRMTKYEGKRNFQHIYPIAHAGNEHQVMPNYITIDCVTDHFDYEVPFSDSIDFNMEDRRPVGEIYGLPLTVVSGVDSADLLFEDLGIFSLKQPKLPLREMVKSTSQSKGKSSAPQARLTIKPVAKEEAPESPKLFVSRIAEPVEVSNEKDLPEHSQVTPEQEPHMPQRRSGFWIKLLLATGVGYGTYKLLELGT